MIERTRARVIGVLFIVASAAAIVGGTLVVPVEEAATAAGLAAHGTGITTGALIELVMVLAVIGIAALFFPILRRTDEGLAMAYVGARLIEAGLLLAAAVSALVMVARSGPDGPVADGALLLAVREQTYLLGSLVALGVGAVILYGSLWRSRIVPTWLSVWGLAGAVAILGRGVIEAYGVELSGVTQGVLAAPIGVNEMVLAVWLIVKGVGGGVIEVPEPEREQRPATTAVLHRG